MITLMETFAAGGVALEPLVRNGSDALETISRLLRTDPRVARWEDVEAALSRSVRCLEDPAVDFGISIRHARTKAVTGMVMSAGRFARGIAFPDHLKPVRYIFCIAVPLAFASDYLRIVGLLARILGDGENEARLRGARSAAEFVATLGRFEAQL
jgi:PTS system nitrogen regulatory IIA component